MLERDSIPLNDDKYSANSADHPGWSNGGQMYGGDLFAANEMPETYATDVSLSSTFQCTSQLTTCVKQCFATNVAESCELECS